MRAILPVLLVSLVLAGCNEPVEEASQEIDAGPVEEALEAHGLTFPGEAIHAERWFNGTVPLQEGCNGIGLTGCVERFDIKDLVPSAVPVSVTAELTYDPGSFGSMSIWMESDGTYYRYSWDMDPGSGTVSIEATLRYDQTLDVAFGKYWPDEQQAETPYQIHVVAHYDPEILPPRVPVVLPLAAGEKVSLDGGPFLLYGPDDVLINRFTGSATLAADAPGGDHIIYPTSDGEPGRVTTNGSADALQAIGTRWESGEYRDVPPEGSESWDFSVPSTPAAVGVGAYVPENPVGGGNVYMWADLIVSLTNPDGFDMRADLSCGVCPGVFGTMQASWGSGYGDPSTTMGTYTITVESQGTTNMKAGPWAMFWER